MITKINLKNETIKIDKMINSFFIESKSNKIIGIEVSSNILIKKIISFPNDEMDLSNTFLMDEILKLLTFKKQEGFYLFDPVGNLPFPNFEECYYFIPKLKIKEYPNYIDWFYPHIIISLNGDWCIYFRPDNIGVLAMRSENDYNFINTGNKIDKLINNYLQGINQSLKMYIEHNQENKYLDRLNDSGFFEMMNNIYGEKQARNLLKSIGINK